MSQQPIELLIPDLDRLAWMSLQVGETKLPIRFESVGPRRSGFPEPVTIAVIALGLPAITAIAAWLLKERERGVVKQTIRTRTADGVEVEETIELTLASSRAPKADIIKALGKATRIDVASLLNADGQ